MTSFSCSLASQSCSQTKSSQAKPLNVFDGSEIFGANKKRNRPTNGKVLGSVDSSPVCSLSLSMIVASIRRTSGSSSIRGNLENRFEGRPQNVRFKRKKSKIFESRGHMLPKLSRDLCTTSLNGLRFFFLFSSISLCRSISAENAFCSSPFYGPQKRRLEH